MNNEIIQSQVIHPPFSHLKKNRSAAGQIPYGDQRACFQNDEPMGKAFDITYNIMDSIREPLLILDSDLKIFKANRFYYEKFNVKPKVTEGKVLFDLGNRQWDILKLKELLNYVVNKNSVINNFEVEDDFETIGRRIMHLNAWRILGENSSVTRLILLSIEDVTERERQKRDLVKLVEKRTVELIAAREDAEKRQELTEISISQIKKLKEQLEGETVYQQKNIKLENNHEKIIGQSDGLKSVLFKIERVAAVNTSVLIQGETGTGKGLVAQAIHSSSLRKNHSMIKVNCAALPSNLIENELFGHEKGAFTGSQGRHRGRFEIADGTTIFLDEIGELPLEMQAKLLRVVQEGEFERLGNSRTLKVDVRIIAATNRNLEEEVRKGRFREDLWYRLNVFPITVPPLRDRSDDIPLLVEFFVQKIAKRLGKVVNVISKDVMDTLQNYNWPGNIRELENVLERAVVNSSGPKLQLEDELNKTSTSLSKGPKTLEAVERAHVLQVLEQTQWKISGKNSASEILGLNRSTLRARMNKLNIKYISETSPSGAVSRYR